MLPSLRNLEKKNITGHILTTNFLTFNDPDALKELMKYSNLEIKIFEGEFHTKGYYFHHKEYDNIIVGSSNFTDKALKSNVEWNIRLSSTHQGDIISDFKNEFKRMWSDSVPLDDEWIDNYRSIYNAALAERKKIPGYNRPIIKPTPMQEIAVRNIGKIRTQESINGEPNRALIISATGTGKTYISAFDVKEAKPKRLLFCVHRGKILKDACESYKNVIGEHGHSFGIYKGEGKTKNIDADYLFASVATISRNLDRFRPNDFDYIVFDEAHHLPAEEQQRIYNYFKPKFILGMTATPDRTDGKKVYPLFDYNIPFEVRLSDALEENLICPFHYFGISELLIDGTAYNHGDFYNLSIENQVKAIVNEVNNHPFSGDRIRGLIFTREHSKAIELQKELNNYYKVATILGNTPEDEREKLFDQLQSDDDILDFIISIDVLNEGVDLPRVNEIIMLRDTDSPIVFIQQLGRGLRKRSDKEFVTILDFIGNYEKNYNIPIALFGDNTRNKENLRRKMMQGNNIIPGASTVHFDPVAKSIILKKINSNHLTYLNELKDAYIEASSKFKEDPTLCQLYNERSLDPRTIVSHYGSLNEFKKRIKEGNTVTFSDEENNYLGKLCRLVVNGQRPYENLVINKLIEFGSVNLEEACEELSSIWSVECSPDSLKKNISSLNKEYAFVDESICSIDDNSVYPSIKFKTLLENKQFSLNLKDACDCGLLIFDDEYKNTIDSFGFSLYKLYTREDYCRITNASSDNKGVINGYKIMGKYCPLFVTYKKAEGVDPQYRDHFINKDTLYWESRFPRHIGNKEISDLMNSNSSGLIVLLFVKKDANDGKDFYYCGRARYIIDTAKNAKTFNNKNEEKDVVSMEFKLDTPLQDDIYEYLISEL